MPWSYRSTTWFPVKFVNIKWLGLKTWSTSNCSLELKMMGLNCMPFVCVLLNKLPSEVASNSPSLPLYIVLFVIPLKTYTFLFSSTRPFCHRTIPVNSLSIEPGYNEICCSVMSPILKSLKTGVTADPKAKLFPHKKSPPLTLKAMVELKPKINYSASIVLR